MELSLGLGWLAQKNALTKKDNPVYVPLEKIWHTQDSQSQILALASKKRPSNPFKLFPLRSVAADQEG